MMVSYQDFTVVRPIWYRGTRI